MFSQSRWPASAFWASRILVLVRPAWATALRTELLKVASAVVFAQLASAFHTPHPPVLWRV